MNLIPTKLGTKLMIWIAGALLLIFVILMYMILRVETRKTIDWTRETAEIITKTVEKSMEQSMNQGDMETIQAIIEDVGKVTDVAGLRVVNQQGVITRSSKKQEVGDVDNEEIVTKAMITGNTMTELNGDNNILRTVSPLLNIGTCVDCHDETATGEPLGLLDLRMSIKDKIDAIARTKWMMILGGLVMLAFVSVTVFILIHRLVLRYITSLSHAAGLMAQGNTNISVDIQTSDEIGDLGAAFNRMVVNVNDANEKNSSIINGISDPMMSVDNNLVVNFVNEPMEELTGYRREEVLGEITCRELLHCDICGNGCFLQKILQGKEGKNNVKMNINNRSGREIPTIASSSALKDSLGKVIGAISIIRDITKEKESEQKLADEVSWSESVIKAIADPMFTVDSDKNITFINEAALAMTSYEKDEAVGRKCYNIFKGDICNRDCLYDRSIKQKESIHGVERNIVPKEGAEILARASGSVLQSADMTGVGFLEIMRDVTDEQKNINNLFDVLKHIQSASGTIISNAKSILENSEEQKKSVSEQSSSVKEVATTIEELDVTSQQTAEKAEGVVQTAQNTVDISKDGQKAVEDNIEVMNTIRSRVESIAEQILDLSQQAQQIGSIITAVDEIAEQTNLLALNAAIEAARAGEHGRGFTVVAMEVKKLAEQSQAATAKISGLINEIQHATKTCVKVTEEGAKGVEEGVRYAATAGETIEKVINNIAETADAVQQIATIAKQQSVGIQQVSIAMANINTGMNQTTRSAEDLSTAAEQFSNLADQLNELVKKYKI